MNNLVQLNIQTVALICDDCIILFSVIFRFYITLKDEKSSYK